MIRESETLPCPLTDDEWAERSDHCARLLAERDTFAAQAKADAKENKDELAKMDESIRELSKEIRDRRTWRDVQVRTSPDYAEGVMQTVRCDTGEVIRTRPLTLDEKQQKLPSMEPVDDDAQDHDIAKDDAPRPRGRGRKAKAEAAVEDY